MFIFNFDKWGKGNVHHLVLEWFIWISLKIDVFLTHFEIKIKISYKELFFVYYGKQNIYVVNLWKNEELPAKNKDSHKIFRRSSTSFDRQNKQISLQLLWTGRGWVQKANIGRNMRNSIKNIVSSAIFFKVILLLEYMCPLALNLKRQLFFLSNG